MKILAHGLTDKGLSRKNNEDSFYSDKDLGLFIVADGMGGQLSVLLVEHQAPLPS